MDTQPSKGNSVLTDVIDNPAAGSQAGCRADQNSSAVVYDPLAPTIFHEDWWLDTATRGNFEIAEVSSGGRTVGRLPFFLTRRLGIKMIRMPILTYFLGPAICGGEGSANNRFLRRLEITHELLGKLPRVSWHYLKCQGGITDVIAFQEHGFRTYVQ